MNMRKHLFIIFAVAVLLLLVGCAANAAPIPTETAPPVIAAVATEPPIYQVFTVNPNGVIEIPDESVPLASPEMADPNAAAALTKRQAEAIAIEYAGLTQQDVAFLYTELDKEDGIDVFEVSFRSGDYAYEFEIVVASGEILSFEKENWRKD